MLKPILFHLWIPGLALLAAMEGFKVEPPVVSVEQPKKNETSVRVAPPAKSEPPAATPTATPQPAPAKTEVAPAVKPLAEVAIAETPKSEAPAPRSHVAEGVSRVEVRAEAHVVVKPKSIAPPQPVPSAKAKLLAVALAQANGRIVMELSYRDEDGTPHQVRMCGSKVEVKCQLQQLPKPINELGSELLKGK